MSNILDLVAAGRKIGFVPSSPDDYFALRLAQYLGDNKAAGHYAELVSEYSRDVLLRVYGRAMAEGPLPDQLARRFHDLLGAHPGLMAHYPSSRLLAIQVTRRSVAAAMFSGTHLEGVSLRHLATNPGKAEASAAAFTRTVLSESRCESVAMEPLPKDVKSRRAMVHQAIAFQLHDRAVAIQEVEKQTMVPAFSHPPIKSRRAVRKIVTAVWPLPDGTRAQPEILDALALGLYVQTERLFHHS